MDFGYTNAKHPGANDETPEIVAANENTTSARYSTPSFAFKISLTACGFALPWLAFMT